MPKTMTDPPHISETGVFRRVVRRALARQANPHVYTTHLLYESILVMPDDAETVDWKREVVLRTLRGRDPLLTLPFSNLLYSLGDLLLMPTLWDRYLREVLDRLTHVVCSPEGAWMHPADTAGARAVLLDGFQEEASRLAKGANLLRRMSGDPEAVSGWDRLCANQFRIHRAILRNPGTGLWHNGRGWIPEAPTELSPGAWSRGHGWLMRGLVESLDNLPPGGDAFQDVREILTELSATLRSRQDENGMWHTLLHRPPQDSAPESSGSALMAAAWMKAVRLGVLPSVYGAAAMRTVQTLSRQYVDPEGRVLSISPGPGPLTSEKRYLRAGMVAGDAHGDLAIGFLLAECLRERGRNHYFIHSSSSTGSVRKAGVSGSK